MFYLQLDDLNSNIVLTYNNKLLKFKKINGKYVASINDTKGTVSFIFHHEFNNHLWFLKALIFYLLSFIGLFMKRYSKCFYKLDVNVEFVPQIDGTYYDIILNDNPNVNNPVSINGGQYYLLSENKFIFDEKAKKNFHIYKIFSIIFRIIILILVVIILIVFLI